MPATIYSRLNDRDFVYSRNDLRKIAYWTHEKYLAATGKDPEKVEQDEEGKVFQVFIYPDEWIEKIDEVTDWYFKKKRRIGEQHIKREQKAKAAKEARERRQAEKNNPNKKKDGKGKPNQKGKNQQNRNFQKNKNQNQNQNQQNRFKNNNNNRNQQNRQQNPNQRNQQNRQQKPGFNKPYNNRYNNQNRQQYNNNSERAAGGFSSYESDMGADYRNAAEAKSSYVGVNNEQKFSHKVELDNSSDTTKRKRIAKALFIAAPPIDDDND